MATRFKKCDQCGRVGTRGFKTVPITHKGPTDGIASFTVCVNNRACQGRWLRPIDAR